MTPFERLVGYLATLSFSYHWLLRGLFLFGMLFYLAFGVIVIRQVGLMSKTLNGAINLPIKIIAWVHLGVIIVLMLVILLAL